MNHQKSKEEAISIAEKILKKNPVYLDTETTGLDNNAEIIDISIIDHNGSILIDSLVRPVNLIPREATEVHGITNSMVKSAPKWDELWPRIIDILDGQVLGIYNADYDLRLLKQTCRINSVDWQEPYSDFFCIMKLYAKYYGEWNDYHKSYKWQSLENASKQQNINLQNTHRAKDDTLLTRALLHHIAGLSI